MKKQKTILTASRLRVILSVCLILVAGLTVALFYFGRQQLETTALTVSHSVADASASENNLASLEKIQEELAANKDVIDRIGKLTADSQGYNYQNQIITDLKEHASKADLTISTISFTSDSASSSSTGATTPATGATTTPGASGAASASGLNSVSIGVTLQNPVPYDNLLRFIRSLEQNLTKMQIAQVGLTKADDGGVTTEALTIKLYTR